MKLTVRKRGNSLSLIIPKEIATQLNIEDGDSVYLTKTPNGYEISATDPDFAQKMELAREGIKKYRNALIDLAQCK
ncbi:MULTISPECIES: AbrB/MazE/SpoVT family DNA-binding domain-containing protein [Synechocystis]|jgi:putative addiction module antidote|uniref:AbrB/MazE/SpoVT family DNA-binding domain-containing protein n=1 Tax=Synechocystis salina LEGE 00031 TaxID=1828736 RepID=A0ABR9VVD8_9SYNC|nr:MULTISPECIES: AbrB/MazE/SpoVT family DNA-binding domain-containing protein [Synechocystis]MBE9194271.1 AbrB/MazE/SpoVT family DNA-binding domain-containing protein [Synechocystis sp. LEGE 06083]MBE9242085.1 AbrB/MazE/SpoVT family DNA-binding domain-containing protein [Synechocystis salina LEGE 00041]MBE9255297.1 AbrB/MazE/SpoVT family DNA-binding domain-containing protein [Synechocystis salina LEGE 00031]